MSNKLIFYSGLPRSGSHLFSAILGENKSVHSEGASALCRILWEVYKGFSNPFISEELKYFDRELDQIRNSSIQSIINNYYSNTSAQIILDKNRSWTTMDNIQMIMNCIDEDPKFVVLTRDFSDVVKSLVGMYMKNSLSQSEAEKTVLNFNEQGTNPFMRPVAALLWAKVMANDNFLFIDYSEIVNDTEQTLNKFYKFVEIEYFNHNLNNILSSYSEKINMVGLSDVRSSISVKKNNVKLSTTAQEKIDYINSVFQMIDDVEKNLDNLLSFYYNNIH